MTTTDKTLITVSGPTLRKVLRAISYAAADRIDPPTHFTETVLVSKENASMPMVWTCTDGFRMHQVELFGTDDITFMGTDYAVFGVKWLQKVALMPGDLYLTVTRKPDSARMTDVWTVEAHDDDDHVVAKDSFDIGGKWPNVGSLIDHDTVEDAATGFNPAFFSEMVRAAAAWWEKGEVDDAFPLMVKQMAPHKVSTFTLRNSLGRLKMTIMPKIVSEDDDEY